LLSWAANLLLLAPQALSNIWSLAAAAVVLVSCLLMPVVAVAALVDIAPMPHFL
jgi:hypothetical protein